MHPYRARRSAQAREVIAMSTPTRSRFVPYTDYASLPSEDISEDAPTVKVLPDFPSSGRLAVSPETAPKEVDPG